MIDPHLVEPDHLPTPFTAAEIRDGCPAGREIRVLVEEPGATYHRVIRFVAVDGDGAVQESRGFTTDGTPLEEPSVSRSSWDELQRHAVFPTDTTTRRSESLSSPLGRLACRAYEVVVGESDVTTFWFDIDRPGMPVKVVTRHGDRVVSTMTMIADSVG